MSATLFTMGKFRAFTLDGSAPLTGGKLYSYTAGTLTPKNTFTDQSGGVANTNPVVLDASGSANVWLNGNYYFELYDANGVLQWTEDNISDTIFSDAFTGTSTTSLTVGSGTKVFVTQSGKSWSNGQFLIAASEANPANYMLGSVTDYTNTSLTLSVSVSGGSGTYADWNIALSGTPGPQGPIGPSGGGSGNVNGPGTAVVDGYIVLFDGTSGTSIKQWTSGPGSAAALTAGTSANNVVQLDGSAKLPAIDGSQLTNLDASNIISGTIATARLGSGTADSTTFLRGDQTWASPSGSTTFEAVGTYLLATTSSSISAGDTVSGSSIGPTSWNGTAFNSGGASPAGTWRNMGKAISGSGNVSLFVRTV